MHGRKSCMEVRLALCLAMKKKASVFLGRLRACFFRMALLLDGTAGKVVTLLTSTSAEVRLRSLW